MIYDYMRGRYAGRGAEISILRRVEAVPLLDLSELDLEIVERVDLLETGNCCVVMALSSRMDFRNVMPLILISFAFIEEKRPTSIKLMQPRTKFIQDATA